LQPEINYLVNEKTSMMFLLWKLFLSLYIQTATASAHTLLENNYFLIDFEGTVSLTVKYQERLSFMCSLGREWNKIWLCL